MTDNIPVLSEVFGATPDIIPYTPTILSDEQLKALKADIAAMPQINTLGGQYYDYMLGLMNRSIPGFSDILAQGGELTKKMQSTAAEELAGQIPQDVADQVRRSTAYQNLGAGTFGGAMGTANQARNLGLTSLDMIQRGTQLQGEAGNAAQRWANLAQTLNMNPSSFFITPEQQAAMTMQNNLYQQATQQRAENQRAMPNPVAKGISDTIINLIGAYLGKGGGGGQTASQYEYGGQGANLGFGGNYQSAMYGTNPVGVGGAAGSAMSPWKSGATDYYFPTQQSYNAFQQGSAVPQSSVFSQVPNFQIQQTGFSQPYFPTQTSQIGGNPFGGNPYNLTL